jgi:hypothetical protein
VSNDTTAKPPFRPYSALIQPPWFPLLCLKRPRFPPDHLFFIVEYRLNSLIIAMAFEIYFIYLALPTRAGSPQQHMPITVDPFT